MRSVGSAAARLGLGGGDRGGDVERRETGERERGERLDARQEAIRTVAAQARRGGAGRVEAGDRSAHGTEHPAGAGDGEAAERAAASGAHADRVQRGLERGRRRLAPERVRAHGGDRAAEPLDVALELAGEILQRRAAGLLL